MKKPRTKTSSRTITISERRASDNRVASHLPLSPLTGADKPIPRPRCEQERFCASYQQQNRLTENSEGQVKYCGRTFFGHATLDRAGEPSLPHPGRAM